MRTVTVCNGCVEWGRWGFPNSLCSPAPVQPASGAQPRWLLCWPWLIRPWWRWLTSTGMPSAAGRDHGTPHAYVRTISDARLVIPPGLSGQFEIAATQLVEGCLCGRWFQLRLQSNPKLEQPQNTHQQRDGSGDNAWRQGNRSSSFCLLFPCIVGHLANGSGS